MAGEKVTQILRSRTELSEDEIANLTDAQAWQLLYSLSPRKSPLKKVANQICFIGFSPSDKERLSSLASEHGLGVVKSETVELAYLVTGPNASPSKLKKAASQDVIILNERQFAQFLNDGEIPM